MTIDTLNVWEENLPDFDQEAIGAKYKGVNKEQMAPGRETAVWVGEVPHGHAEHDAVCLLEAYRQLLDFVPMTATSTALW